jgi:hypothetical protein
MNEEKKKFSSTKLVVLNFTNKNKNLIKIYKKDEKKKKKKIYYQERNNFFF